MKIRPSLFTRGIAALLLFELSGLGFVVRVWAQDVETYSDPSGPDVSTGKIGSHLLGSAAYARDLMGTNRMNSSGTSQVLGLGSGNEYISGNYNGAVLIPVTILGPVTKPGVHHIPTRTNVLRFMALAGGTDSDKARLDRAYIKRVPLEEDVRKEQLKEEIIPVDLEKIIKNPGTRGPLLQQNDILVIPPREPLINANTSQVVGFASGLVGIVLSVVILSTIKK